MSPAELLLVAASLVVVTEPAPPVGYGARQTDRATINVVVHDYAGVPTQWLQQARSEMARIYREAGVNVVWWDARNLTVPRNLLIVMIRRTEDFTQRYSGDAMGAASGTADDRGRVAYVFYDRTEQFTPLYRGRFLGHFMAHEVGHLLLPQYAHSPTGLMRAQWSREDLERAQYGRLGFTPEQATQIRSKAAQLASDALDP